MGGEQVTREGGYGGGSFSVKRRYDYTPDETTLANDTAAEDRMMRHRLDLGYTYCKAGFRCTALGRFAWEKVVGPPRVRIPKPWVSVRFGPLTLAAGGMWRMTGYSVYWMAKRRPGPTRPASGEEHTNG